MNASTVARAELDELMSSAGVAVCEQICDDLVNEWPAVALDSIRAVARKLGVTIVEVGAKVRKPTWEDGESVEVLCVGLTHFFARDLRGRDYMDSLSEPWEVAS